MCRNKRRFLGADEFAVQSLAMEGAHVLNGLEYKMTCSSSKVYHLCFDMHLNTYLVN